MLREIERTQSVPKDDPLYRELKHIGQKQPFDLYINKNHRILKQLVKVLGDKPDTPLNPILHPLFHDIAMAADPVLESHLTEYQASVYGAALEKADIEQQRFVLDNQLKAEKHQVAELQAQVDSLRERLADLQRKGSTDLATTDEVLFIRPMENEKFLDFASEEIAAICSKRKLELVDPKEVRQIGDIPTQITDLLKRSRLVIADISDPLGRTCITRSGS